MIDSELLSYWKQKFGDVYIAGQDYYFRALSFREHDRIIVRGDFESSADIEEAVVAAALLHPSPLPDRVSAGVVSSLAEEILEVSGFSSPRHMKEIMAQARQSLGIREMMKAFVLATMGNYKEEELDELTFAGLARKVALAEQIIQVQQAVFGIENSVILDIVDPEEEAQKHREQVERHAMVKKPGTAGLDDPIAAKLRQALG